jgi:hypothetical protein
MFPNMPWKTMGGKVFWNTLSERYGWRLQQNVFTEHYRILDPEDIRQAWGTDAGEMWRTFHKFTQSN